MAFFGSLFGKRKPQNLSELDWSNPSVISDVSKAYEDHFGGQHAAMIAAWTVSASGRSTYIHETYQSPDESGAVVPRRLKMVDENLCEDGELREKYIPFLGGVDQGWIMDFTENVTEWCQSPEDRLQISYNLAEAILARHIVMPDEI